MKYRYSIIIPVYNSAKTIERCLNSILFSYRGNAELIVVNDGSVDQSDQIIQTYVRQYSNIVYIQKENGGVSSARNAGLKIARGEYILFVDSDDYVLPNYFRVIDGILDIQDVDLIAHDVHQMKNKQRYIENPVEIASFISGLEYAGKLAQTPLKVFSKALIEKINLRFWDELVIGEDVVFVFSYVLHIRSAIAVKECIYQIVLDNSESLSRKKRTYLCDQSLLMREKMKAALDNADLISEVYNIYDKMFTWSFYHGAYSVCKELLKFDMPFKKRMIKIGTICKRFNDIHIRPRGAKSTLLAIPIRFKLTWFIYIMIIVASLRQRH